MNLKLWLRCTALVALVLVWGFGNTSTANAQPKGNFKTFPPTPAGPKIVPLNDPAVFNTLPQFNKPGQINQFNNPGAILNQGAFNQFNNPGFGNQFNNGGLFNQFNNPGIGNQFNNPAFQQNYPSVFQQQSLFQQYQMSRYLTDYMYLSGGNNAFINPYFAFSPVVSQYGYYGNPWSPLPFVGNPYGYQFYPGQAFPQNNLGFPFGNNNPFLQQGPFNATGGGVLAPNAPNVINNPANIFK